MMADRKEQVKRDIAATLANMKEDELGNIIYNPRSAADIIASKKSKRSQYVNNYDGNLKRGETRPKGNSIEESRSEDSSYNERNTSQYVNKFNGNFFGNLKRGGARPKAITIEGDRSSDETLIKKVSFDFDERVGEKEKGLKSKIRKLSPIRKFRHKSLMDRSVKSLSPTSTNSSDTAPTKYIFAFGSANTYDDEITFHSNESGGINIGRECGELRALNDTICIGLERRLKCDKEINLKDTVIAQVKNAAQMDAMGEKMNKDCEGITVCEGITACEGITKSPYEVIDSMMMQMAKQESYSFPQNESEYSDDQTESEYSDEQAEETNDKKGDALKKTLRNAIKTKLFRKGNTAGAQMEGLVEKIDTEDCEEIDDCEGITGSPYKAVNSMMMQMAKKQSYLFGARDESEYVYSDEQTEEIENIKQRGALKSLRNAIKAKKDKLFKKGNDVANSAGDEGFKMHQKNLSSAP